MDDPAETISGRTKELGCKIQLHEDLASDAYTIYLELPMKYNISVVRNMTEDKVR